MKIGLAVSLVFLLAVLCDSLSSAELPSISPQERLGLVLQTLMKSSRGRKLVLQAQEHWKVASPNDLGEFLKWGTESRTDAVVIRHFDPKTGKEEREREVTVLIKSSQPLSSTVLDLAHELSHALTKPAWDPYDPNLTASDYILSSIEGPGGEVEAVQIECEVATELVAAGEKLDASRCKKYLEKSTWITGRAPSDFYRVGSWYPQLVNQLGEAARRFPHLSPKAPLLYSSTGNAPYPISLLREFDQITSIACDNSRRRIRSVAERKIAAIGADVPWEQSTREFIRNRCQTNSI